MPPERFRLAAEPWLAYAEGDLAAAQACADHAAVPGWTIAFHCQQAIEKSYKGALHFVGVLPPKSHELVKLHDLLAAAGIVAPLEAESVKDLSPFAIDDKYPRLLAPQIDRAEAADWIPFAQQAVAWLRAMLAASP